MNRGWARITMSAAAVAAAGATVPMPPLLAARGTATAYLVNVTVRPGYQFTNADAALKYGYRLCEAVARGEPYRSMTQAIATDFAGPDGFHASYLISQAVNELCPQHIWQLRR